MRRLNTPYRVILSLTRRPTSGRRFLLRMSGSGQIQEYDFETRVAELAERGVDLIRRSGTPPVKGGA